MILDNANVLTMDPAMPRAAALAIAGGRVLGGVDSREDAIASHVHERVDMGGATIVPGFADSHAHVRAWAAQRSRIDLRTARSADEVLERVRAHVIGATDPVEWVLAAGWPSSLNASGRDLGSELHDVVLGRPVALVSRDGHALWTTPATLDVLGVDVDALDDVVERGADGSFTGILRERAAFAVRSRLPWSDVDTRTLAAAMREAARRGVTTVHDVDGAPALRAWRTLDEERGLALRVWVHLAEADLDSAEHLGFGAGFGTDRLRIGGVKVFADGTFGSRTANVLDPPDGWRATSTASPAHLRDLARRAGSAGLPLVVHAIGDAAVRDVVDALEATSDHWSHLAVRPRIEHAQLVRPDDVRRCAALGIGISIQPTHLAGDREILESSFSERLGDAYPWRTMVDSGCGLLLGSDAPIEDLDPLAAIAAAVTRLGWHADEALDPETALLASTAWPADATGVGGEVGRLVPGHAADLVVLDGDPLAQDAASISVVATMVGGRWTHGAAAFARR